MSYEYDPTKAPEYYNPDDPNQLLDMADFPYEVLEDKYVLLEYPGTIKESYLSFYDNEIDALKIGKRLGHKCWEAVHARVAVSNIFGMKVFSGYEVYEENKRIK